MTDRERSAARRRQLPSNDQPRTNPAAVEGAENDKHDDIWLTNFMSRLTGTLRNIASRKPK
jgi:hypothetical protein